MESLSNSQQSPSTTCPPFEVCVRQSQCWDADNASSSTAVCFLFSFAMISIGLFFVVFGELGFFTRFFRKLTRMMRRSNSRKKKSNVPADPMVLRRSRFDGVRRVKVKKLEEPETSKEVEELQYEISQTVGDPAFTTTRRTEDNFVKDNIDPTLQVHADYDTEYYPQTNFPSSGFLFQGFVTALKTSVLLANCWISCLGKYNVGWATACVPPDVVLRTHT